MSEHEHKFDKLAITPVCRCGARLNADPSIRAALVGLRAEVLRHPDAAATHVLAAIDARLRDLT